MSVLIKGMEMPKGCIACPFMFFGRDDCLVWCKWLDEPSGEWSQRDGKWRHPDCPLVEVPTPHGRLIDEVFISQVEWYTEDGRYIANAGEFETDAPTIIEAEKGEPDVSID